MIGDPEIKKSKHCKNARSYIVIFFSKLCFSTQNRCKVKFCKLHTVSLSYQ